MKKGDRVVIVSCKNQDFVKDKIGHSGIITADATSYTTTTGGRYYEVELDGGGRNFIYEHNLVLEVNDIKITDREDHVAFQKELYDKGNDEVKELLRNRYPHIEFESKVQALIRKTGLFVYNKQYKIIVDEQYVKVPFPHGNREWALEAYQYVIDFCANAGREVYPVGKSDGNFLYINVYALQRK